MSHQDSHAGAWELAQQLQRGIPLAVRGLHKGFGNRSVLQIVGWNPRRGFHRKPRGRHAPILNECPALCGALVFSRNGGLRRCAANTPYGLAPYASLPSFPRRRESRRLMLLSKVTTHGSSLTGSPRSRGRRGGWPSFGLLAITGSGQYELAEWRAGVGGCRNCAQSALARAQAGHSYLKDGLVFSVRSVIMRQGLSVKP